MIKTHNKRQLNWSPLRLLHTNVKWKNTRFVLQLEKHNQKAELPKNASLQLAGNLTYSNLPYDILPSVILTYVPIYPKPSYSTTIYA